MLYAKQFAKQKIAHKINHNSSGLKGNGMRGKSCADVRCRNNGARQRGR